MICLQLSLLSLPLSVSLSLSSPRLGPFIFTYNSGHGDCKSPVSNIESCTEESRLLLNLQACPDVAGTESTGKLQLTYRIHIFRLRCDSILYPATIENVC